MIIQKLFLTEFFISLLFLSPAVSGQDSVYTLKEVEVTATRTGISNFQSFNLLDSSQLHKGETGLSFEESLNRFPGLIINDRNNPSLGDKISIRGIGTRSSFGVRGIKIILDNIPLTLPDGQSQTNNIDFFSAGKIEILKGPASSLYGNSAGGVINIQSEISAIEPFRITPAFIFGENGLKKYSLKLSGKLHTNSYLININKLNYTGFREHSARNIYQLNTVYRNILSDDVKLSAVINYFNSPYLLNPSSLSKASVKTNRSSAREFVKQQGAGEKADQLQGGITLEYLYNNSSLETTLYLLKRDLVNPIPGRIIDLKRTSGGVRSILKKNFSSDQIVITLSTGIDVEFQDDTRKEFENNGLTGLRIEPDEIFKNLIYGNKLIDQQEYVLGIGPFISTELYLNRRLGFLAGLRYDHYSFKVNDIFTNNSGRRIMQQLSPAAGIFYKSNVYSRLYFNYSTAFQTPTTAELSNRPDLQGGFNPGLQPEKVYQFELGAEYFLKEINTIVFAAIYFMSLDDLLVPYQLPVSEEVFFKNAGKAENKGVEILIEINPNNSLNASLSYSFMNFVYRDYITVINGNEYQMERNKIPGIPKQILSAYVEYENETGIWCKTKFFWVDKYFTNDFNGPPPGSQSQQNDFINESYLKIDLRLGYRLDFDLLKPEIFLGINNLLNKKYNGSVIPNAAGDRFFEPAPCRTWYAGIQVGVF